jgi:hypothetical protein
LIVDLVAGAGYFAVTALFYDLSKPVNRSLPLLVAFLHFVRPQRRSDSASAAGE